MKITYQNTRLVNSGNEKKSQVTSIFLFLNPYKRVYRRHSSSMWSSPSTFLLGRFYYMIWGCSTWFESYFYSQCKKPH